MPRHVNTSLKAADRIPGLRPKPTKVRGAPPPWADWVHKFGPLVTAVVSAGIFFATLHYTIEPIYRRALLEESNAQLETKLRQADKQLSATQADIDKARSQLVEQQARISAAQSLVLIKESDLERAKRLAALQLSQAQSAKAETIATEARLNAVASELSSQRAALVKMMADLSANERKLVSTVAASISGHQSVLSHCYSVLLGFRSQSTPTPLDQFDGCVLKSLDENRVALAALRNDTVLKLRAAARVIDGARANRYAEARQKLAALVTQKIARENAFEERRKVIRQAFVNSPDRSKLVDLAQEENVQRGVETERFIAAFDDAWAVVQSGLDDFYKAANE